MEAVQASQAPMRHLLYSTHSSHSSEGLRSKQGMQSGICGLLSKQTLVVTLLTFLLCDAFLGCVFSLLCVKSLSTSSPICAESFAFPP